MARIKIVTVVGARPQFIKVAAVSRALRSNAVNEVLVHTGQHYDTNMSEVFFQELELPEPNHLLNVGSGSHGAQTGSMMGLLDSILKTEAPDWVLVYGDTNSTLAGALSAAKMNIPVAHVEAGLRSFNRQMPEEINRVVTDHVSTLLFAPTQDAVLNLRREGIDNESIINSGDVMCDSVLYFSTKAAATSKVTERLGLANRSYVLVTVHRAENTDAPQRMTAILEGIKRGANGRLIVFPIHPRTRKTLDQMGLLSELRRQCIVTDPLGYLDMLKLQSNADLIITDSGGLQKEAYLSRVRCVTLRTETEWNELVRMGWNRLACPYDAEAIAKAIHSALSSSPPTYVAHLYGEGRAADIITCQLKARANAPTNL